MIDLPTTCRAILDHAANAYQRIPADHVNERIESLYGLADAWQRLGDTIQADMLFDEVLTLLASELPPLYLEDAIQTVAASTLRYSDLQHLEDKLPRIADENLAVSATLEIAEGYHRLGHQDDARRCLAHCHTLDPDCAQHSEQIVTVAASLGDLSTAYALADSHPERRNWRRQRIARVCMSQGRHDEARQIYLQAWADYQAEHLDADSRCDQAIDWNLEDCRHLIALGELPLLRAALPYVMGFLDSHPMDFWLDLAQAYWDSGDTQNANELLVAFADSLEEMADPYEQARKQVRLARQQRRCNAWLPSQATLAKARRGLAAVAERDQRFYLYHALIEYHLEHPLSAAADLCQEAHQWLLRSPPPNEGESGAFHGYCEGILVADLVKSGLHEQAWALVASARAEQSLDLHLSLADSLCKAQAWPQAEQAIAQVNDPYWQVRLYLRWLHAQLVEAPASDAAPTAS